MKYCFALTLTKEKELMNKKHLIRSLNMQDVEILTLDKADDRMEFEALSLAIEADCGFFCACKGGTVCSCHSRCDNYCPDY